MAKTEKSKAELYRQERKERIASAAKKNAKKSRRNPKVSNAIGKIVGIVVVVAAVCAVAFAILDSVGAIARMQTAFTIGKEKISVAEYGYMYYMQYQNTASQAQQSEQNYGYNMYGFDYKKSPEDQDTTETDSNGKAIKWSKKIEDNTIEYLQEFYALYNNAIAKGYKVTAEEKEDIDEQIESFRQSAVGDGKTTQNSISMSLNSFLKLNYGKGVTENFLRTLMEKEMIVQRFSEDKQKEFTDKYTNEELDKEYKKDPSEYDVVDLRIYSITPETLSAEAGETEEDLAARQKAENDKAMDKINTLLSKVTDEASFVTAAEPYIHEAEEKAAAEAPATEETAEAAEEVAEEATEEAATETAEAAEPEEEEHDHDNSTKAYGTSKSSLNGVSEDLGKWAFDKATKAGDKKAIAADNGTAYAVLMVKTAYSQDCVDVRHILFTTQNNDSGEKLSADEIAEKKAKCEEAMKKWEDAEDKSEDYFAELANEYTEDPGSNTNGGLYEHVTPGQMVNEFDQWIFDKNRKTGDVEVIESEYGYHIMYYVGNMDKMYRNSLRTTHTQDDYSGWLEAELEKDTVKVTKNAANMAKGYDRAYTMIDRTVQNINAQANAASYAG